MIEAAGADGVDKEIPVDPDEDGRGQQNFQRIPGCAGAVEVGEFFGEHKNDDEQRQAEDDALCEDLERVGAVLGEEAEV